MPKTQSKKRRALILSMVTVVFVPPLLLLSGATLYLEFKRTEDMDAKVLRSYETRSQIQQTLSLLQDAETGYRGYVITGDEQYLEPYREAIGGLDLHFHNRGAVGCHGSPKGSRLSSRG